MMLFEALVWGIFGALFGSFTNVLILRHSIRDLGGRSSCPHCSRTLEWYELVPIVSFFALRGRCRTCRGAISWQYPLVEVLLAVLFICIGLSEISLVLRVVGAMISILLVAIAVYDLWHTIIPDVWAYSFAALALVYGLLTFSFSSGSSFALYLAGGPLLALPLFLMWFFSGGRWMGLGDAKLVLGFGWLVGIFAGYVALSLAFCLGALVGVCILMPLDSIMNFLKKSGITRFAGGRGGFTIQSEVPFGPFLIFSLCLVWITNLYQIDIPAYLMRVLALSN